MLGDADDFDLEQTAWPGCNQFLNKKEKLPETQALVRAMAQPEYRELLYDNIAGSAFAPENLCRATSADLAVLLGVHDREVLERLDARLHRGDAVQMECRAGDNPFFWPFSSEGLDSFREYIDRLLSRHGQCATTGITLFRRDGLHCFLLRRNENMQSEAPSRMRTFIGCDLLTFDPARQVLCLNIERGCIWKRLSFPAAFGEIFFGDISHFSLQRQYRLELAVNCDACAPGGHSQIKSVTLTAFAIVEYDGNGTEVVITARKNATPILRLKFWPLGRNAVLKRMQFRVVFHDGTAKTYSIFADRTAGNCPYDSYTLCFEEYMAMIGVLEVPNVAG